MSISKTLESTRTLRLLVLLALLLLVFRCSTSHAAEPNAWMLVSSFDQHEFAFKRGSCEVTETNVFCIERELNTATKIAQFAIVNTSIASCKNGMAGTLITFDMQGKELYRNDAVMDGGTVASFEFKMLCQVAAAVVQT